MATQPDFICATCDEVITHQPTFHLGLAFCCAGCAADGPCMCSYDAEVPEATAVLAPALVASPARVPGATVVAAPVARPVAPHLTPDRTRVAATGAAPAFAAARR